MERTEKQQVFEQCIYGVIWTVVFLIPLVGGYFAVSGGLERDGMRHFVRDSWQSILPFFILFLLNNYGLVPRLLLRKKYWQYTLSLIFLIGFVFCFSSLPSGKPFPRDFGREKEYVRMEQPYGGHKKGIPPKVFPHTAAPFPFPPWGVVRYAMCFVIAFLMAGFNIAIKLFFKSLRDEEALKELEHQNLQSQLKYLKYQINPHFFMNTLNNIHALVDIDTDKAKSTLVELSKLMRYVLYEASNRTILLSRELQFLKNYVALMRLRYTEKVTIEMDIPQELPEVKVPPLLFVSLLENAFKHGVSYQNESFIRVSIRLEESRRVAFRCSNSKHGKSVVELQRGVGLENVRKRLRLLFVNDYTLSIKDNEASFDILLIIPLL